MSEEQRSIQWVECSHCKRPVQGDVNLHICVPTEEDAKEVFIRLHVYKKDPKPDPEF